MKIGVFAIQGDFEKHGRVLEKLGVDAIYVNEARQLADIDALIPTRVERVPPC